MSLGFRSAVERYLGKIRSGKTQNLLVMTQFLDFPLQRLNPLLLGRGRFRMLADITLLLKHLAPGCLCRAADLAYN